MGSNRKVWSFDLDDEAQPHNQRLVYDFAPSRGADRMRLDIEGNRYSAAGKSLSGKRAAVPGQMAYPKWP